MLAKPSRRLIFETHPIDFKRDTSSNFRGVPSDFDVSKVTSPLNFTMSFIIKAKSLMEISLPEPMLIKGGWRQELGDRN